MSEETYVKDCAFFRTDKDPEELRQEILGKGYNYLREIGNVVVFKR